MVGSIRETNLPHRVYLGNSCATHTSISFIYIICQKGQTTRIYITYRQARSIWLSHFRQDYNFEEVCTVYLVIVIVEVDMQQRGKGQLRQSSKHWAP